MPKQTTFTGVQWDVGEGRGQGPRGEAKLRLCQFTDVLSGEVYVFALTEDEAIEFGRVLSADDLEEAMGKVIARRKLKVEGQPTESDLAAMTQADRMGADAARAGGGRKSAIER